MNKNPNIKPEDFLELAEDIFTINSFQDREEVYRTIINRCYLSTVLKAQQILEPKWGEFSKTVEFYGEVEEALKYRLATKSKDKLGTLRKWRNDADYNLDIKINKIKAIFAIQTAKYTQELMLREII